MTKRNTYLVQLSYSYRLSGIDPTTRKTHVVVLPQKSTYLSWWIDSPKSKAPPRLSQDFKTNCAAYERYLKENPASTQSQKYYDARGWFRKFKKMVRLGMIVDVKWSLR